MNALVYVETRPYPDLKANIEKQLQKLPDWPLYIFCAQRNIHLFGGIPARYHFVEVNTLGQYNRLLTSERFWNTIKAEKCLIFQHDTGILKDNLLDFAEWDYVGAPWKFQQHGGNGGLSWRNVELMAYICAHEPYSGNPYEDVWFCNYMNREGLKLAPREVCAKFSVETIFQLGTFGYHAIDNWLSARECEIIRSQ